MPSNFGLALALRMSCRVYTCQFSEEPLDVSPAGNDKTKSLASKIDFSVVTFLYRISKAAGLTNWFSKEEGDKKFRESWI